MGSAERRKNLFRLKVSNFRRFCKFIKNLRWFWHVYQHPSNYFLSVIENCLSAMQRDYQDDKRVLHTIWQVRKVLRDITNESAFKIVQDVKKAKIKNKFGIDLPLKKMDVDKDGYLHIEYAFSDSVPEATRIEIKEWLKNNFSIKDELALFYSLNTAYTQDFSNKLVELIQMT